MLTQAPAARVQPRVGWLERGFRIVHVTCGKLHSTNHAAIR